MKKHPTRPPLHSGFSLIEMLVYTAILILIVAAVGSTILALSRVYRAITTEQIVEDAGQVTLERILRTTKDALSIDSAQSAFASTTGKLTLNTLDDDGNAQVVQFFLAGQTLRMKENGVDVGPLTPSEAHVTRLYLTSITTSVSKAVKVEMTIESGTSTTYRSKNFYGTAVLRGSYLDQ